MKVKAVVPMLLCAGLALVSPARADMPVTSSLMPGIGIPVGGSFGEDFKNSFYLGGEGEVHWNHDWATGVQLGYFFSHTDGQELKREFKNLQITPYVKRYFSITDSLHGYAVAGAGIYFVNYDDDAAVPDVDDSTKRYFGYTVGMGMFKTLAKNWEIGLDLRLHRIFRQDFLLTTLTPSAVIKVEL